MARRPGLHGLDSTMRNLNKAIRDIEGGSIAGLMRGGLIIQRESQRRVPVEYGKMRQSAYTRKTPENPRVVEVGYSAGYAVYVHENMEQRLKGKPRRSGIGVYWGPSGQPKFLESAAHDKQGEVVEAVRSEAIKHGRGRRSR